jgi:carbon starvation protein CstA
MFGALYLAVYYGNFVNSKYTLRIISLDAFFWLVIAGIFSSLAAPVGIYLRSHKREPLMALSLVGGFLSLMIIVIFAKYDSIENLTKWYSMLIICLSVFTFCIKRKFKEARN